MLLIRSSQKDVFDSYSLNQYKAELCQHLTRYDSLLCEAAGPEAVKETVDFGVQRAHECGFTLNGPIRTYLEIMLAFGSHFDRDPQYFWLVPWLRPQDRYPEMERARYLQFHVIRYLNYIQGSDAANGIVALKKAQEVTRAQLIKFGSNYPEEAMNWLESTNRLKCRFIGNKAIQSLILSARKEATRVELHSPQSVPLVLGLMFTFGSGILRDPMYPWVARTLASTCEKSKETREGKLLRRAITSPRKMLQQIQAIQKNV